MKKFFSTIFVITVFAFTALAGDGHINSPGASDDCVYGHINSPGIVCAPPETGHGSRAAGDDSSFAFIKSLIAEYNPFVYLLN